MHERRHESEADGRVDIRGAYILILGGSSGNSAKLGILDALPRDDHLDGSDKAYSEPGAREAVHAASASR